MGTRPPVLAQRSWRRRPRSTAAHRRPDFDARARWCKHWRPPRERAPWGPTGLTLVQEIRRDCRDAGQRDSDAECDFRRQLCTAAAGTVGFVREEILRSGIAVGEPDAPVARSRLETGCSPLRKVSPAAIPQKSAPRWLVSQDGVLRRCTAAGGGCVQPDLSRDARARARTHWLCLETGRTAPSKVGSSGEVPYGSVRSCGALLASANQQLTSSLWTGLSTPVPHQEGGRCDRPSAAGKSFEPLRLASDTTGAQAGAAPQPRRHRGW